MNMHHFAISSQAVTVSTCICLYRGDIGSNDTMANMKQRL